MPVGSAGAVVAALGRPDTAVVSNPEFLREGNAVHDWLHPDRIVIGSDDRGRRREAGRPVRAARRAGAWSPIPASAETIKYACNAFLAAKVSFVNAIANLCQAVGADSVDVIQGMSYDRRIGADHLAPGPGWGGSCFPKDTSALIRIAEDHGYDFALLKEVVAANERSSTWSRTRLPGGGRRRASTGQLDRGGVGPDLQGGHRRPAGLAGAGRAAPPSGRGALIKAFDPTLPDPDRRPAGRPRVWSCATTPTRRARVPASWWC